LHLFFIYFCYNIKRQLTFNRGKCGHLLSSADQYFRYTCFCF